MRTRRENHAASEVGTHAARLAEKIPAPVRDAIEAVIAAKGSR